MMIVVRYTTGFAGGSVLARPAGFEPATYGLEVRCSIQLSYGRFFGLGFQDISGHVFGQRPERRGYCTKRF